ncbi:MAG TPA: M24 family metallopeptidase, partial [Chloroflexota bacterium]|nr:M24 family metallopeptidase [Chloroflexota bacterium]
MDTDLSVHAPLTFSLAERDRRWSAIRALMSEAGIDVLVATGNTGRYNHHTADARYVTHIGGPDVEVHAVLPLEGAVTAIARGKSPWVSDVRPKFNRHEADGIVERLQELQADGKRIAVAGLEGLIRSPQGIVDYAVMKRLLEHFPRATFVNGTDLMYRVRAVKSEEEVAFIRQAVRIAEAAVRRLVAESRPDVKDCAVYAHMVAAEIEAGGELPFMLAWHATQAGTPYRRLTQATPDRAMRSGDLIYCQIEGKWQGYCSQMDQTVVLGTMPDQVRRMAGAQLEAFEAAV